MERKNCESGNLLSDGGELPMKAEPQDGLIQGPICLYWQVCEKSAFGKAQIFFVKNTPKERRREE